jgi:hypothetical protein
MAQSESVASSGPVEEHPYAMTLDLSVLDHLGLNLYSNIPAVLSEAVANAWDADATTVEIVIDKANQVITITDDGLGMDQDDLNKKFLTVGYRRRSGGKTKTPRHRRHVMGRKGIGKLSLFSIADRIEVQSCKRNARLRNVGDPQGLVLDTKEIRERIDKGLPVYPTPVPAAALTVTKGTTITLTTLKSHATETTKRALRTRLARRFSVIGKNFTVKIDGEAIGIEDRDYFGKIEYLWTVGEPKERFDRLATNAIRTGKIDGTVDTRAGYEVSGWVGTFDEQKSIEDENNAVSILAWGKLVQEDILGDIRAGGLYTKYLMGEIRADFVDRDDEADIATSDRQSLKETDPRYTVLKEYVQKTVLSEVERSWRDWRRQDGLQKALEHPAIEEWYGTLGSGPRKFAERLFGRIGQMAKDDEATRNTLLKHGVLAFERLRYKEELDALDHIERPADLALIGSFVASVDDLEAAYYHQIVQGRLRVIEQFVSVVDTEIENVIRDHLFDHLWLLHPSWERASTNARVEQSVMREFDKLEAGLTPDEKAGRIDIRYRTAAGKNVIIELKKYARTVTVGELFDQLQKYRNALEKVLSRFPDEPQDIELIAVLGQPVRGSTAEQVGQTLRGINARVIMYDQLIKEAQESYKDYLDANRKLSRLSAILDKLDDPSGV